MKIYKLPNLAEMSPEGAYCLGKNELKTSSVYLAYGRLLPKETGRKVRTPDGYEEVIYVVKGSIRVTQGKCAAFTLSAGEAFGSKGLCSIDNISDTEAVYLAAGGRAAEEDDEPAYEEEGAPETAPLTKGAAQKDDVKTEEEFDIVREDTPEAEEDKG